MMQNVSCFTILLAAIFLPYNVLADSTYFTHTYTPIEIEAVSSQLKGIKLASVCFLGVGDCTPNTVDYEMDNDQRCFNEGFVTSCPSGQKLHKNQRCPYNSSFGTCCSGKCSDNSSTICDGSVVGEDGCGYQCRSCDPCPGYYECGGTWQYCTGTTCFKDASRCSNFCKNDYFPNKCENKSDCKGVYRNGYCSADCTPACVEDCFGDSSPNTGEGWTYSTCTTCSGRTLYNNSAKSCPSGYSTTVDSCDSSAGYRLVTSGKSGNSVCGKCTNSACPDGYDTSVKSCSTANGYVLETNGVSGGKACGKCVPAACPDGYSTEVTSCTDAYSLRTSGKSGGQYCRKCECTATDTTCNGKIFNATTYEESDSCMRNGQKYVSCGACTRRGGTAEGYVSCLSNGKFELDSDARPNGATKICNGITYYESCGCDRAGWKRWTGSQCGPAGYPSSGSSHKTYQKSNLDYTAYYHRGYLYNECYDNGFDTYNGCALYYCSNPAHKVITAPKHTCAVNETVCCCSGDNPLDPSCVRVQKAKAFPDDEL